ncbi:Wzz/FepE/Etk N-terminal domain-containing protein [uncultured Parasphingorhabdus sp.]|uniref:GumC family protein n=1 Tax=uncultured Parasphingorhabdus sp. TaxID=2709694 RepID=UPI0030DAE11A|tara:strand:+ start:85733 stop:87172 length:1440 start_codon:yes stop_codon:yes gene_type:complete
MEYPAFDMPESDQASANNLIEQLPIILWQRRWWIIVPTILGIVAAIAAILLIPSVYRSNAIMLVESPQLPSDVIGTDDFDIIDRRVARIRQQITSRPDLIALIEQYGLYTSERRSKPLSEVIENMREAISLTPAEANIPGSRADQKTIAFELAFDYSQPVQTQAVAQELMNRILQLDASGNVEQATNTVQFLTDQAEGLEVQINDLQGQIAQINAQNGGVLSGGAMILSGNSGSYDVQIAALQRDNQSLLQQRNIAQTSDTRDPVVSAAEQRLAAARAVYSETHPDVIIARQNLAQARELAKSNTKKIPVDSIDEQIAFNNSQIASLRSAKAAELAQVSARLAAQSRAPLVQQQIGELQQRLAAVNQQYDQVQARLMAAKAGVRAEDERMSERLSVVEPPVVPDSPSWPDRLILAVAGIGGGLAIGLFLAFAVELFLRPIRDPSALQKIAGAAPLGIIPMVEPKPTPKSGGGRFSFLRR